MSSAVCRELKITPNSNPVVGWSIYIMHYSEQVEDNIILLPLLL